MDLSTLKGQAKGHGHIIRHIKLSEEASERQGYSACNMVFPGRLNTVLN